MPEKKADPPLDARNPLSADYGGQHYVILSSSSYWRSARKVCAVPPQALWQCKSSPQCACGPLWTTCIEFFHRTPACALDPVPPRFTHPPGACALMSGVVRAMLAVRVKGFGLCANQARSSTWSRLASLVFLVTIRIPACSPQRSPSSPLGVCGRLRNVLVRVMLVCFCRGTLWC